MSAPLIAQSPFPDFKPAEIWLGTERIQPKSFGERHSRRKHAPASLNTSSTRDSKSSALEMLAQARAMAEKGELEAAIRIARSVESMSFSWEAGEESPKALLDKISQIPQRTPPNSDLRPNPMISAMEPENDLPDLHPPDSRDAQVAAGHTQQLDEKDAVVTHRPATAYPVPSTSDASPPFLFPTGNQASETGQSLNRVRGESAESAQRNAPADPIEPNISGLADGSLTVHTPPPAEHHQPESNDESSVAAVHSRSAETGEGDCCGAGSESPRNIAGSEQQSDDSDPVATSAPLNHVAPSRLLDSSNTPAATDGANVVGSNQASADAAAGFSGQIDIKVVLGIVVGLCISSLLFICGVLLFRPRQLVPNINIHHEHLPSWPSEFKSSPATVGAESLPNANTQPNVIDKVSSQQQEEPADAPRSCDQATHGNGFDLSTSNLATVLSAASVAGSSRKKEQAIHQRVLDQNIELRKKILARKTATA